MSRLGPVGQGELQLKVKCPETRRKGTGQPRVMWCPRAWGGQQGATHSNRGPQAEGWHAQRPLHWTWKAGLHWGWGQHDGLAPTQHSRPLAAPAWAPLTVRLSWTGRKHSGQHEMIARDSALQGTKHFLCSSLISLEPRTLWEAALWPGVGESQQDRPGCGSAAGQGICPWWPSLFPSASPAVLAPESCASGLLKVWLLSWDTKDRAWHHGTGREQPGWGCGYRRAALCKALGNQYLGFEGLAPQRGAGDGEARRVGEELGRLGQPG